MGSRILSQVEVEEILNDLADADEADNMATEELLGIGNIHARLMTSTWLQSLSARKITICESFLDCLRWSSGTKGTYVGIRWLVDFACNELNLMKGTKDAKAIHKKLTDLIEERHRYLTDHLESLIETHQILDPVMRKGIAQLCASTYDSLGGAACENIYIDAKQRMSELFGISAEGCDLCEFVYIAQTFDEVKAYFFNALSMDNPANWHLLSMAIGISKSSIADTVNILTRVGVMDNDRCLVLNDNIVKLWDGSGKDAEQLFCSQLDGKILPLKNFSIPKDDVEHILGLMQRKGDSPINILLYGSPGTGKTAFARSLMAHLKVKAWSVLSREQDGERERRSSLTACLSIASRYKGSFVLVDEAERLLDTRWENNNTTKDKAWLNYFLEHPGRRIIWITNQIQHIDKAVRRRFTYSVHFEDLGVSERKTIWEMLLKGNKVLSWVSEEQYCEFAKKYDVPVAVIEKAVLQAKDLGGKEKFAVVAERVLKAHITLDNDGMFRAPTPESTKEYSLDGINIKGSPQKILENCRKLDTQLRAGTRLRPTSGNMLFYGPPGTGKTALARHIAAELDRECTIISASQLIDKYVGETEKNIARAFMTAEREGSVLVFDEVDSFIFTRDIAVRSWESTQVNEFLMQLEESRCLCICTTNRRENLDRAAMRRFATKVEFTYAEPEQVKILYDIILEPFASSILSQSSLNALCRLQQLTPGDFHAVRSQHWFDDPHSIAPEQLVEELRFEMHAKLEELGRQMGF
jgi:SpoVK/Ycf46/Vps4 family AAA+-type ATPase